MADRYGQRVEIRGGMSEFVGKTGRIVAKEGPAFYRVELDRPVHIRGVGMVADDLWEGRLLRTIRNRPVSVEDIATSPAGWR
jgi:hypothetical protein